MKPALGKILISDPFLQDPNFARTIVLLLQHDDEGSFGFVLNNEVELSIHEALKDDKLPRHNLFQGGPVEIQTVHFLHGLGPVIGESREIIPGVWWGADFEKAQDILKKSPEMISNFVFFMGYSGWAAGQLDEELEEEAWIVSDIGSAMVFNPQFDAQALWKKAMRNLGGKYAALADSPSDPSLN
jgi:putative transcriptional regulator